MEKSEVSSVRNVRKYRHKKYRSKAVREALLNVLETNICIKKTSELFNLPCNDIDKIYNEDKTKDEITFNDEGRIYLEKIISEDNKLSLFDIQKKLKKNRNINVSTATVSNYLKKLNYSFKRNRSDNKNKNNNNNNKKSKRTDIDIKETECHHKYLQLLDEERIGIFYHRCKCRPVRNEMYGWVKKGQTFPKEEDLTLKSKIISLIFNDEIIFYAHDSCDDWVSFVSHLEDLLSHVSNTTMARITFIMENSPNDNDEEVRQFIEKQGHELLYLPPKNVFFKSVKKVFYKWKTFIDIEDPNNLEQAKNGIEYFTYLFMKENLNQYYENAKNNFLKFLKGSAALKKI